MEKEVRQMKEKIGCDAASVWLVEGDMVYPYIFAGPKGQELEGMELKIGDGLCGYCIEHGVEIISNSPSKEEHWYQYADEKTQYETRNIICLPIIINDECIGCIELLNKNGDFTDQDVESCRELIDLLIEEL